MASRPGPLKFGPEFKIVATLDEILGIVGDSCVDLTPLSVRLVPPLVVVEPYVLFSIEYCGSLALWVEVVVA